MRCSVIGANGFLGKHLVHYIKAHYQAEIECYDIFDKANLPNYQQVDMANLESAKEVNVNVDYIFMFAGLTGTYAGFDAYEKYISINEIALLNLLEVIRKSNYRPKIIFPSTRLVYEGADKPLKETDNKESRTIYSVNKIACEGILQAYRFSFDIPYTIFRICIPYGNLLSADYSFGTVGFFIKQAMAGKDITLYGGGTIKRTFTHMEDLCRQVIEGAFKPESNGEIYNIGGETLSLHDAAEIIAKRYGVNVTAVPWPERDLRIESDHTFFDDTKIQALLGGMAYKRLEDFSKDI